MFNSFLPNRRKSYPGTKGILSKGIYPGSGVPRGAQIGRGGANIAGSARSVYRPPTRTSTAPAPMLRSAAPAPVVAAPAVPAPAMYQAAPRTATVAAPATLPVAPTPAVGNTGTDENPNTLPGDRTPTYEQGFFMYDGKWAYQNKNGDVSWSVPKAPKPGKNHIMAVPKSWKPGVTPPKAEGYLASYHDTTYQDAMADLNAALSGAQSQFNFAQQNNKVAYDNNKHDLEDWFKSDLYSTNASMAARGFGGSGAHQVANKNRVNKREQSQLELEQQFGSGATAALLKALSESKDLFKSKKNSQEAYAKDRYFDEHPNAKKNRKKGFWQKDGVWYYTNANGVTNTTHKPKKKKKAN